MPDNRCSQGILAEPGDSIEFNMQQPHSSSGGSSEKVQPVRLYSPPRGEKTVANKEANLASPGPAAKHPRHATLWQFVKRSYYTMAKANGSGWLLPAP